MSSSLAQQAPHLGSGQGHAEHAAHRHGVEQLAAQQHQADAVFERHHAGQAGRRVLAHAVADQSGGLHAPRHPQLRQRVLHDHDQRQLHRGALELLHRLRVLAGFWQPQGTDVVVQLFLQHVQAAVHPVLEHGLGGVELARHAGVLGTAAREHEHHLGVVAQVAVAEHAAGVGAFQQGRGFFVGGGHQHAPVFEGAAALLERERHVGQRLLGVRAQVGGQCLGIRIHRRPRAARHHQQLERPVRGLGRRSLGRFLQHGMGVGAAHAQRVHASAPWALV